MKRKTIKRIVSCILSVLLLASTFMVSANANEISDAVTEENTKSYLVGEEKTFNGNKDNGLDITGDLDFFTGNSSGTWTMSFKTTNTGFSSLVGFAATDSGTQDQYIAVYLSGGNTIGIEIRKDKDNTHKKFTKSYSDGKYHTLTFTVKENEYYKFYFDGECVLSETADSTKYFANLGVTFGKAGIGGITRSNGSGWGFNGTMKDVYLSNFALDETEILKFHGVYPESIVSQTGGKNTTGTEPMVITDEFDLEALKTMDKGSVNVTYKRDSVLSHDLQSFLAFSNGDAQDEYATFYLRKDGARVGFEFKTAPQNSHTYWDGLNLNDGNWHNIGFVFDGTNVTLYVDGVSKGAKAFTGMLSNLTWINNLNTAAVGGMVRTVKTDASQQWFGDFNINKVTVYSNVMSASQMALVQNGTGGTAVTDEQISDRTALFYSGYAGSDSYRIPALITSNEGTVIAAIDQRKSGAQDNGDIDLMVRRSEDGGKTWGEPIMLTDLPSGGSNHSFTIDSELLVSADGTIYCLVDMFPESTALMGGGYLEKGSGYKEVDGKKYMILYDAEKNEYTLRDNGIVYTPEGEVSDYKVTDFGKGTLVKTVDGVEQSAGSIFLYSGANKGELSVLKTSYLWLFKSTDDGLTWSDPVDVTGMVKADWMVFCGTGPGRGTTTIMPDGTERLIFSIYHTNGKTDNNGNSQANLGTQASAAIYSDDGGITWTRGESPVVTLGGNPETGENLTQLTENQIIDLGNGKVVMFSRNYSGAAYMSISTDGGATWDTCERNTAVYDSYCQMSAITHEYNGRTYLLVSGPNAYNRLNMTIRVTDITDGTISTDSADWSYTTINNNNDSYSCLTSIDENTIGILYETNTVWHNLDMLFQKFDFAYLLEGNGGNVNNIPKYPEITAVTGEVINGENGSENVTEVGDTVRVKIKVNMPAFASGDVQLPLRYKTSDGVKTVYADYVSGSGTNEIYFDYVIEEAFRGEISAVLAPIANLESSTGRQVSSLRNGEAFTIANYGTDLTIVSATAGSEETVNAASGASKAIDGDTSTIWHSKWGAGNNRDDLWITLDLGAVKEVSGLRYLPRQSQTNGIITEYDILVSTDGTEFTSVAKGTWAGDSKLKTVEFNYTVEAKYVKLVAVDSISTEAANTFASAAEIQLFYYPGSATEPDYKAELTALVAEAKAKLQEIKEDTNNIWYQPDVTALEEKTAEAEALLENSEATSESLAAMIEELNAAWTVRIMTGDVNKNGKITVADATMIQLYCVGMLAETAEFDEAVANTNGDDGVDVADATEIQKYVVGIIDILAPAKLS